MLNGCTTMLSLLLWIAWRMDLRNDFNLVKFHIHPVTFIALTLSSRYCRLHECLWPVVHRQGCGRVELGSFWRLKASLDTKKQISSVLEDLLFDAISVCVCVRVLFTPNFVILQLFLQIDMWTTNLVQKFGHGADQKIRVYSWISRKEWTSHDSKKDANRRRLFLVPYLTSIYNMHIA